MVTQDIGSAGPPERPPRTRGERDDQRSTVPLHLHLHLYLALLSNDAEGGIELQGLAPSLVSRFS